LRVVQRNFFTSVNARLNHNLGVIHVARLNFALNEIDALFGEDVSLAVLFVDCTTRDQHGLVVPCAGQYFGCGREVGDQFWIKALDCNTHWNGADEALLTATRNGQCAN